LLNDGRDTGLSAELLVAYALEDVEEYLSNHSAGQLDDILVAQQAFADEIRRALRRLSDEAFARTLGAPHATGSEPDVQIDDSNSLTAIAAQLTALQFRSKDSPSLIHQPEIQNVGHNESQVDSTTFQPDLSMDDQSGEVNSRDNIEGETHGIDSLASNNLDKEHEPTNAAVTQGSYCVACNEITAGLRAPCDHHYCADCLVALVKTRIADHQLPVKCCRQTLYPEDMFAYLPDEVSTTLRAKSLEYLTPNKVYYHNSVCAAFVPPAQYQDDVATCAGCKAKTCVLCKSASHDGLCPTDKHAPVFFTLANEQRWRQCFQCKNYVERISGCDHIM